MTLLDAQEYDPEKARKRRMRIISAIVILLIVLGVVWFNRYWPEERIVGHFFRALQTQDYKTAYGIWMTMRSGSGIPTSIPNIRSTIFTGTGDPVESGDWSSPTKSTARAVAPAAAAASS